MRTDCHKVSVGRELDIWDGVLSNFEEVFLVELFVVDFQCSVSEADTNLLSVWRELHTPSLSGVWEIHRSVVDRQVSSLLVGVDLAALDQSLVLNRPNSQSCIISTGCEQVVITSESSQAPKLVDLYKYIFISFIQRNILLYCLFCITSLELFLFGAKWLAMSLLRLENLVEVFSLGSFVDIS